MDRTEIIERLKNIAEHAVHTVGEPPFVMSLDEGIAVHEAIKLLTNCPEIPDSWIPCSERLPEKDGRYLVTRHDYVTNTEFIDILWYEKTIWWNGHSTGDYAVTAWMPLPEPWKGE